MGDGVKFLHWNKKRKQQRRSMFNLYMLKKNLEYYLKIKIYLAKLSRYFVSDTLKMSKSFVGYV